MLRLISRVSAVNLKKTVCYESPPARKNEPCIPVLFVDITVIGKLLVLSATHTESRSTKKLHSLRHQFPAHYVFYTKWSQKGPLTLLCDNFRKCTLHCYNRNPQCIEVTLHRAPHGSYHKIKSKGPFFEPPLSSADVNFVRSSAVVFG